MEIIKINDKSDKLYYVGGIVRDEILGYDSLDVDLIYEGNAIEFARDNNLQIVQKNEPFGTVRVKINGKSVDIASTRCETYPKAGHLPKVFDIGCALKDDVKRRDFTVNSLYKSVNTDKIIDFTNGINDLKNKKLKVLHKQSFVDDPTRILRALKFRMRFGFTLDTETRQLQEKYLKNINYDMSYKRIKKELVELFGYSGESKLSLQKAFKIFVEEKIYKLVTEKECKINCPIIINSDKLKYQWIIYAGILEDLSKLPLTKNEKKILEDLKKIKKLPLKSDIDIYKAFKNCLTETVILYGSTVSKEIAQHYLKDLKNIKLKITGNDLINLGLKPSKDYKQIFDTVLAEKIKNPKMTKQDELNMIKHK